MIALDEPDTATGSSSSNAILERHDSDKIYPQIGQPEIGSEAVTGVQRMSDLVGRFPKARAAIDYAERRHADQRRTFDGRPFIEHPLEVVLLLEGAGAPDDVIAAGVLHDTIEKTGADPAELEERFGARVAQLVVAVSEDAGVSGYAQRKAALRQQVAAAGPDALMVFAADKISKVHELRLEISRLLRHRKQPTRSLLRPRRLAHYRRSLGMLEEQLGRSALVDELRSELGALEAILATARARAAVA
jgi:HD domain